MEAGVFTSMLDDRLVNPLLRGLDVSCVRFIPEGDEWWSPRAHRKIEVYLYPGPFGADRLRHLSPSALALLEEKASEVVGAHEARILPSPPVPLRLGEWVAETGYCAMFLGPVPFLESSLPACAVVLTGGYSLVLTGQALYNYMWRSASHPRLVAASASM